VQVRDVGLGHDLLDCCRVVVAGLDERDVPVGPRAGVVLERLANALGLRLTIALEPCERRSA